MKKILSIIVVLVGIWLAFVYQKPKSQGLRILHVQTLGTVFEETREIVQQIAKQGIPVLIKNGTPQAWLARQWTPEKLISAMPVVEAYQQAHRTFITFHDGKPLEPHIKNKSHDFNMKQQVETRRLFSRGHVNSSDPWYYFSSNFKFLPKTSLGNFFTSILPYEDFFVKDDQRQVIVLSARQFFYLERVSLISGKPLVGSRRHRYPWSL
jgi:hypothetical protein